MQVEIEQRGLEFWAKAKDEDAFFVGSRVRFGERAGLCNVLPGAPPLPFAYMAGNYAPDFGIWARLIAPTIKAEGGSFLALNSYDRAAFTFGIGQFAAHVPDGDFVCLMRALLRLPEARHYFPELRLIGGRIGLMPDALSDAPPRMLEDARSTEALMRWFNPSMAEVDAAEISGAARLLHWTRQHRTARLAQIEQMVAGFRKSLRRADKRLGLHGQPATLCCVIADLIHHGRAGRSLWPATSKALGADDPLDALLAIGSRPWPDRIATLRTALAADPDLATLRWSSKRGDFDRTVC